jgi:voltage-gated potassium channel
VGTTPGMTVSLPEDERERQRWAEDLHHRLTPAMSALGILFLLVVLGETFAPRGSALGAALGVLGWLLWGVFAAELVARLVLAPDKRGFWRRNWWQVAFLLLPFLRVLGLVLAVRFLRTGRVLSSAVRSARSARSVLGTRVGWLGTVTAITVLATSQLLYEFGDYREYGDALHAAALATITGEPLARPDGFSQVLEVVLAAYSVIVFATLAGSIGGYFLETRRHSAKAAEAAENVQDQ